jgi:2-succinyl-6-hydroxy-2,4-cyclohexadiene-1-carboxylate synthase
VTVTPTGAPLFTLHGFTGRADAWAEVVTPGATMLSLIGHADDLPVPAGWTFEQEIDRVAARIAGAAAPVHLAGYSMGGRVALGVACRRPERIARLTVVAAHPGLTDPAAAIERRAADDGWCALLERDGLDAFVAAWQEQVLWQSQRALSPERRERQRRARLAHSASGLAGALRALGLAAMPSLWHALPGLPMPVDWVAGELDSKYRDLSRRAAAACRSGRALVIPGAGHNVLLEQPEELARALAGTTGQTSDERSEP